MGGSFRFPGQPGQTRLLRQPTALVVDDDAVFREVAGAYLEGGGFAVHMVATGEEALEAYESVRPDVVLLDLGLPGRDGFSVCAELRDRHGADLAPVLMVTADHDDNSSLDRGFQAGATDFIAKPINWLLLKHRAQTMIDRRNAMAEVRESQSALENAQRIAHLGSYEWDLATGLATWSEEAYRILGIDGETPWRDPALPVPCVHPDDRDMLASAMEEAISHGKVMTLQHRIMRLDGSVRRVHHMVEPCAAEGDSVQQATGVILDVTDHVEALEKLRWVSSYDPLTGLTNRRLFGMRLADAIERARVAGESFALMVMDLDRFKRVNDTLGHTAGDQLLQTVSRRIRESTRSGDLLGHASRSDDAHLSRLGGDEFTLLTSKIRNSADAALIARRLQRLLQESIEIDGQEIATTTSIGIALYPEDGLDGETLLKHADAAMYNAKDKGGDAVHFYSEETNAASVRSLSMEAHLRNAAVRRQFQLHYQPKVDLRSRRITGMEALLRWDHPELGRVGPDEFVPLAEECGLIVPIGDWVLATACEQNKAWQDAGLPAIPVAVNVSSRQLIGHDLKQAVFDALEASGLDPHYLELEITESAMMRDQEATARTLRELREIGVTVALDDFGTGYSSLSHLRRFPLDSLKIDRSFVQGLPHEPDAVGVINAIIAMAHVMKLNVVAEGVETRDQDMFLTGFGCDEMQGYLFSKALSPAEFAVLLEDATKS